MPPPTITLSTPATDALLPLLLPTSPPLNVPVLDKRQTYVTVSVMKNATSTAEGSAPKENKFPVAIAIPALVGGMALALAAFGLWWWWTGKQKKERRAAWEARQRRKRKRAEQSARPSVSSARANSAGTTGTAVSQKSPISEKGFVPPVPALPKTAAQQDPFKERGYGYPATSPTSPHGSYGAPEAGAGAFGYAPQPGLDNGVTYGYDEYGQPIPQYGGNGAERNNGGNSHRRSVSNDSSNPSNPFGSNAYPAEKQTQPLLEPEVEPQATSPTSPAKEEPPARTDKSSRRAAARMAVAESAAASASVDPAYRHQPKKPSPLALAAAERKAAEAAAERERGQIEHLSPPGESSLPPYDGQGQGGNRQVVSGEWGVALGSPHNDGQFDINRRPSNGAAQNQKGYAYEQDPYLQQKRAKSGQYGQDPYAAYHGEDEGDDDDVYHRAAEGMGLGGANTPKGSSWV